MSVVLCQARGCGRSRYNSPLRVQVQTPNEAHADMARLQRVVARDPSALGELYDEHSRRLFGVILRILNDRGEAEETLQDVFVQVWARASTYMCEHGSPAGGLPRPARETAPARLRPEAVAPCTPPARPPP